MDKRERSANFTVSERNVLISLIKKHRHVLENKKSGATTWKNKELAWKSIEREFNARSGEVFRSMKTLKIKYEGLKRALRKKSATIKSELYKTDGDELEIKFEPDELPPIQDTQGITQQTSTIDDLNQAKLEVTLLQKQKLGIELTLRIKELEEKQKEWDFAAQERIWREQKMKMELELLNKQLNIYVNKNVEE